VHAVDTDPLIRVSPEGLYCAAGDFYIDPWRPVERAVITHAHSDHARVGSRHYLCAAPGASLLRHRMGTAARIESVPYGQRMRLKDAIVSLHPAGHILGSAQIRVEAGGDVWVISGDYNFSGDPAVGAPFEPVPCRTFITESTFGLPIYHWPAPQSVFSAIEAWWQHNQAQGVVSVMPAYPLGKSQRLLAHLESSGAPIAVHGNANDYIAYYRAAGIRQAEVLPLTEATVADLKGCGLIITSSAAQEATIFRKLGPLSWAFASGWMMTRAARRNRDFDRGFVLSDHADWDGLIEAIRATGAERVGVTHGQIDSFSRWLREQGWDAFALPTCFSEETAGNAGTADAT